MDHLFRGIALEEVAAGARLKGFEDVIVVGINRKHQDLGSRKTIFQQRGAFEARHAGQVDVHEHDIRGGGRQEFQRFFAGLASRHTMERRVAPDDFGQTFPQFPVIFNDADVNFHGSFPFKLELT